MSQIDLTFLLDDPAVKDAEGLLVIEPLAPLSMNATVPGKHYQTALHPPERHIYGLLENALGLHFGWSDDYKIRKHLADAAAADISISYANNRAFQPLIAAYVDLERVQTPEVDTYDDLQWAHKWRDSAQSRAGTMHHDWRGVGDDPARYGYGKTLIHREHVVAEGAWTYSIRATPSTLQALTAALDDPAAPLYLGTNDGWVHATIQPAP